jgi:hypothetical protein
VPLPPPLIYFAGKCDPDAAFGLKGTNLVQKLSIDFLRTI